MCKKKILKRVGISQAGTVPNLICGSMLTKLAAYTAILLLHMVDEFSIQE
jgi:hypothetical protein